jgi:hypothetical protein
MSEIDEIERLEAELYEKKRALQIKQQNCNHEWGKVKFDPEKYKEAHYSHLEGHGSDPEAKYTYSDAYKDRWSRTCHICGKVEYTYKQKPVKCEPDFKNE